MSLLDVLLMILVLELICEVLGIFWRDWKLDGNNGSRVTASGDSTHATDSKHLTL